MKAKKLTPQERIFLTEELFREVEKIQNKPWKPFWKTFPNFHAFNQWKKRQKDPRLW